MPRKGKTIEFFYGQAQFKVPFMMYYGLEALLPPTEVSKTDDPNEPYTIKVYQHIPCGWNVRSKFACGEVINPEASYRGKDCIETLCDHLVKEACRLYHMFPEKQMDPLTNREWKRYKRLTRCHICFKNFNFKDPKVRDHCHYTGHYRGPPIEIVI